MSHSQCCVINRRLYSIYRHEADRRNDSAKNSAGSAILGRPRYPDVNTRQFQKAERDQTYNGEKKALARFLLNLGETGEPILARVSSADFRPHERLSHWSEVISRTYARAETRYMGDKPFRGDVAASELGRTIVTNIGSEPMQYTRSGRALVDHCDHFFVGFTVSGSAAVEQDGRQSKQRAGDIVAYNSGKPYINHFPETYKQVVLIVPRAQMVSRLSDIDRLTSTTLRCETPVGKIARKMFEELGDYEDSLSPDAAAQLGASVLDVLTLAMKVELLGNECATGPGIERLDRIKRYLLQHLETPALAVERIAKDNAVSLRTLHRLFAARGESVQSWFYEQRLHAGYRALAEGRMSQVTEAAITYGFADASHFAKAFKSKFGLQPSALLRRASPDASHVTGRAGLRM